MDYAITGKEDEGMKRRFIHRLNRKPPIALWITVFAYVALFVWAMVALWFNKPTEKASSFVGYSQSCWQVGDTLTVITAKGDTVRLDVSRLED